MSIVSAGSAVCARENRGHTDGSRLFGVEARLEVMRDSHKNHDFGGEFLHGVEDFALAPPDPSFVVENETTFIRKFDPGPFSRFPSRAKAQCIPG
jgi:hypothetical protein